MSSSTLLGHLVGKTLSLSAATETPCFLSASMFLSDECSPASSIACRISHASKRSFSDGSSHTSISGHPRGMGCSSLSLKCFTGPKILMWLKFSLYLPASLLLQVSSQANICLEKILTIKRKLTCFAVVLTGIELSHKVSVHILFVLMLVLTSTSYCSSVCMFCPVPLVKYFSRCSFFLD